MHLNVRHKVPAEKAIQWNGDNLKEVLETIHGGKSYHVRLGGEGMNYLFILDNSSSSREETPVALHSFIIKKTNGGLGIYTPEEFDKDYDVLDPSGTVTKTQQAIQWHGGNYEEVSRFVGEQLLVTNNTEVSLTEWLLSSAIIHTDNLELSVLLYGNKIPLKRGDYVIRDDSGVCYPVSKNYFETLYVVMR